MLRGFGLAVKDALKDLYWHFFVRPNIVKVSRYQDFDIKEAYLVLAVQRTLQAYGWNSEPVFERIFAEKRVVSNNEMRPGLLSDLPDIYHSELWCFDLRIFCGETANGSFVFLELIEDSGQKPPRLEVELYASKLMDELRRQLTSAGSGTTN